jgi:hypothetical protein
VRAIQWPPAYHPTRTKVFVSNEITIPAPAVRIWSWLIRAQDWPEWYGNASDVAFLSGAGPNLYGGARFRWKTFGAGITSTVREFRPYSRLAWDAKGIGINAYHAWLLEQRADGTTRVLTEETQKGWLARLSKLLVPDRMHRCHQQWLESLSEKALLGFPSFPSEGEPSPVVQL